MNSAIDTRTLSPAVENDLPVNLPEQEFDIDNIAEVFRENTKFFRASFLPQAARIIAFLSKPQLVIRGTRGYHADVLPPRLPLGEGLRDAGGACDVLGSRTSVRSFSGAPMSLSQLGSILHYAMRANRIVRVADIATNHFRPYPSGGALYPTECYVLGLRVVGRSPFAARYDQRAHELEMLDVDLDVERFRCALCHPAEADGIAAAVVLTSVFSRSTAKYGPRGYRFALLEAGHAAQNLCLAAAAHDLGTCLNGGFFDDDLNALCRADGVSESAVTCLFMGYARADDGSDKYGPRAR